MNGESEGSISEATRIKPAYEQVADRLRELIVTGTLDPGDQLPIEVELAAGFGVSRSTVREALRVLASQGIVRTVRGVHGGSFVATPSTDDLRDFLQMNLGLLTGTDELSLEELLETRELLEVSAARLAAERATDEDDELLRGALRFSPPPTGGVSAGRDVHAALFTVTRNALMWMMAEPLYEILRIRFRPGSASTAVWSRIDADHGALVEAIVDRDPDRAEDVMAEHLRFVRGFYGPHRPGRRGR